MKRIRQGIVLVITVIGLLGCKKEQHWGNKPFIEMNATGIILSEQIELCKKKPESVFCRSQYTVGDIAPTKRYALEVLHVMNSNFKYKEDDIWHYNDTVYQRLKGDCEDIASTMAKHMIDEGIDPKYLSLVYRKISETETHMFLAVETLDAGILHLDYSNSGYPIEPQINFHMKMNDAGVDKWIKGNIKPEN